MGKRSRLIVIMLVSMSFYCFSSVPVQGDADDSKQGMTRQTFEQKIRNFFLSFGSQKSEADASREKKEQIDDRSAPKYDDATKKNVAKACAEDIKKSCKDVEPGKGRIIDCLRDNKTTLSVPCAFVIDNL